MGTGKVYRAIGLMSGTSLDGVDAALIETDGAGFVKPLGFYTRPYDEQEKPVLRAALGLVDRADLRVKAAAEIITKRHIDAVRALKAEADIIGFHGQTIFHDPGNKITVQIGDGGALARATGIPVVDDFRSADVAAGGQGAPLLPLYHCARAMADGLSGPVAVLNIGGVANVTWINGDDILAFDTGPGNALIDDFVKAHTGQAFDKDGRLARAGRVAEEMLEFWMRNPYFMKRAPKSLDRDAWDVGCVKSLSAEDGAATLAAFTVETIAKARDLMMVTPKEWLVAGGGRNNQHMMKRLQDRLGVPVRPVDALGWNGDALEAEGFAYLAVRSLLGQPISLPSTTGVPAPMTGGKLHKP